MSHTPAAQSRCRQHRMSRSPRHTPESVAAFLVEAGGTRQFADVVVDTLTRSSLSAAEIRHWIDHPQLAYPIKLPPRDFGGQPVVLEAGTTWCVEQGHFDLVLNAVREFADASPNERLIVLLLQVNIADVRLLTGLDAQRERVVAEILTVMRNRLRKPQRVSDAACSSPQIGDGRRIVDRILRHEEHDVLIELQSGQLDLQAILDTGKLDARWDWDRGHS